MAGKTKNDEKKRAHFTFLWKIESSHPKCYCWYSPEFIAQSMEVTKWKLGMYTTERGEAKFSINRARENEGPHSIEIEFEISILDNNGSSLTKESSSGHFEKDKILYLTLYTNHENLHDRTELAVLCRFWRIKTEISTYELCFASTEFEYYKYSCVWAVKGFSSLKEGEKGTRILNSAEKGCPQLILTLSLAEKNKEKCIFIQIDATVDKDFEVEAKITPLDAEGKASLVKRYQVILYKGKNLSILSVFEKNKLLSNKTALLSDDLLLLRCEYKLASLDPIKNIIENYKLMNYSDSNLVQEEKSEMNFELLNETAICPFKDIVKTFKADGALCDISLRVGTKSFPAHKLILSSRSPVFKAMFTRDMKEKNKQVH